MKTQTPTLLQIRAVLARLVRRLGFEAVEPHVPPSDAPLLKYLVKEASRRARKTSPTR